VAIFRIPAKIAFDPSSDGSSTEGRRVVAHGFRIGQHGSKRVNVFGQELAKLEAIGFENGH
jgi:hypothetical protein